MFYSFEYLLWEREYSIDEINNSMLIFHPKIFSRYDFTGIDIICVFEQGSNFTVLDNPIIDEFGIEYWNSEWYYMAQRTNDLQIKKHIASNTKNLLTKKVAYQYRDLLERDPLRRIEFMRKAIKLKFDRNEWLKHILIWSGNQNIIEYTFFWDSFFWVDDKTKKWSNILWKLLIEYREQEINK